QRVLAFDKATVAAPENVALVDVLAVLVLQTGKFHQDDIGLLAGAVDRIEGHAGCAFPGDKARVIVHLSIDRLPSPELDARNTFAADRTHSLATKPRNSPLDRAFYRECGILQPTPFQHLRVFCCP